jgi:uncharacterized protein YbaR (Trm112 family)
MTQIINQRFLELLRCPIGNGPLVLRDEKLVCTRCGIAFPIRDGIPVLLLEEAELPAGVFSIDDVRCLPPDSSRPA